MHPSCRGLGSAPPSSSGDTAFRGRPPAPGLRSYPSASRGTPRRPQSWDPRGMPGAGRSPFPRGAASGRSVRDAPRRTAGSRNSSPGASFASFLFSVLGVLRGMLPVRDAEVRRAIGRMESHSGQICSQNPVPDGNPSPSLAAGLTAAPVIHYPAGLQSAAARFKNSLPENAKMHRGRERHQGVPQRNRPLGAPGRVPSRHDTGNRRFCQDPKRWSVLKRYFEERPTRFLEVSSMEGGHTGQDLRSRLHAGLCLRIQGDHVRDRPVTRRTHRLCQGAPRQGLTRGGWKKKDGRSDPSGDTGVQLGPVPGRVHPLGPGRTWVDT